MEKKFSTVEAGALNNESRRMTDLTDEQILSILADRGGRDRTKGALRKIVELLRRFQISRPEIREGLEVSVQLIQLYMEVVQPTGKLGVLSQDHVAKKLAVPEPAPMRFVRPIKVESEPVPKKPHKPPQPRSALNRLTDRDKQIIEAWNGSTLSLSELAPKLVCTRNVLAGVLHRHRNLVTRTYIPERVRQTIPGLQLKTGRPKLPLHESKQGVLCLQMCRKHFGCIFTLDAMVRKTGYTKSEAFNALYKALGSMWIRKKDIGLYELTEAGIELGMSYRDDMKGVTDAAQTTGEKETIE